MLFDGVQDTSDLRKALEHLDSDASITIDIRGEGTADFYASSTDARDLARRPEVIAIQLRSVGGPSSEREAQIAVGHYANGLPTSTPAYRGWLAGLCGGCMSPAQLAEEKVAVFDTGLSETTGVLGQIAHPDLDGAGNGTRLAYPTVGCCGLTNAVTNDTSYHGTVVTGLIAGDPLQPQGLGRVDSNGFYWGMGIAPGVSFGMTRMMTPYGFSTSLTATTLAVAIGDAFLHDARYQNNSWNLRPSDPASPDDPAYGYDAIARKLDVLVRDALAGVNGTPQAENPMTIVVSTGNITQSDNLYSYVRSPATAKNIISVGATGLAVWDYVNAAACRTGIGIRDLSTLSRRGTSYSAYGTTYLRLRPDLVAPGRSTVSTRSYSGTLADCAYDSGSATVTYEGGDAYLAENGTSFAAPQVTGAAVLVKRFVANSRPGEPAPSPALIKAVLLGTAETLQGGHDYVTGLELGYEPSVPQGYGRLSLKRLIDDSSPKVYEDQNANILTATGASKNFQLTVADPSKPVIVSLVYTDPPSSLLGSGYTVNQLAVNVQQGGGFYTSCDLGGFQQYSARVSTPCGAAESPALNAKQVRIAPNSFSGAFTVQVIANGINGIAVPQMGTPNQDFALFVYNAVKVP